MNEENEIIRYLGELCIKGFGAILEDQAKKEENEGTLWDIAQDIGEHMQEDPAIYYNLGECIYNIFKEKTQ